MNTPTESSEVVPIRSYRNPPVVEAFCEVYFTSSSWDDSVPEEFFKQIKDMFPRQEERMVRHAEITVDEDNVKTDLQHRPPRKLFIAKTGDGIIQITRDLFIFNQLTPYRHFDEWKEHLFRGLSIYKKLTSPQSIERIGIRYMNRFEIPGTETAMEDYFTVYPTIPLGMGNRHRGFLIRFEIPLEDQGPSLLFTLSSVDAETRSLDRQSFMLDLYAKIPLAIEPDETELKRHITLAHKNVVKAFEGSITDNLRALFNKKEPT